MPPRGGEGGNKKPTVKQARNQRQRQAPIPVDLGVGKAVASIQQAAKAIAKNPPPQSSPPVARRKGESMAHLSARALAATRAQQAAIIANQQPSLRNVVKALPYIGVDPQSFEHPIAHAQALLAGPPVARDARGNVLPLEQQPVSAGIAFPGGDGKIIKGITDKLLGRGGVSAEAAAAVKQASKDAFYENLPPDAQQVAEALPKAKGVIRAQEQLRRAERAKRFAAAKAAKDAAGGGEAGLHAYLHELRGKMPTLSFDAHGVITQDSFDNLLNHIDSYPALKDTDKLSAKLGLARMVRDGIAPQPAQLAHLHTIFGYDFTNSLVGTLPWFKKVGPLTAGIINVPRTLMASFDFSAPFRQGLILGARHPIIFAKEFKTFKALWSEGYAKGIMESIHTDPWYDQAVKDKLSLTDPEGLLTNREEQFMYKDVAEKIPVIGRGVRGSGRGYTTFLDKFRFDVYKMYAQHAASIGKDFRDNPEIGRSVARFINSATGRGSFTKTSKVEAALNATFFSPRLFKSRLDFLNPLYYAKLDPFARKQASIAFVNLLGAVSATLYLAKLAGAKVNADPTNADFAKIRFNNTRIDILGGIQQPVRLGFQLLEGKVTSSTTGKTLNLGQGYGQLTRMDVLQRFLRGKLNPSAGVVADLLYGSTFQGQPLTVKDELTSHLTPLSAQDAADTLNQYGNLPLTAGTYGLGAFGIGVQTYGPRPAGQQAASKFVKDSRAAGLGDPSPEVMDELRIKKTYDSAVAGSGDLKTKFKNAAKAYEDITGDSSFSALTANTGAEAAKWTETIRARLAKMTTHYDAWEAVLQKRENQAALR